MLWCHIALESIIEKDEIRCQNGSFSDTGPLDSKTNQSLWDMRWTGKDFYTVFLESVVQSPHHRKGKGIQMRKFFLILLALTMLSVSLGLAEETATEEAAETVTADPPVGGWVLDTVTPLDSEGNAKEAVSDTFVNLGYAETLLFGEDGTFRSSFDSFTYSTGVIGVWEKNENTVTVKDGFENVYTYTIEENGLQCKLDAEIRNYVRSEEVELVLVSKPVVMEAMNADACQGLWKLAYYTAGENGILISAEDVNIGSFVLCMNLNQIWVLEYDQASKGYIINEEKIPVVQEGIIKTADEAGNASDAFTVQLCENGWMLVVENGTSMYFEKLDASQVTVNDRQTSPGDSSILKFKQMKTKKAGVNIRVEPDKKSELVVSLKKKGEEVLVLTQKKNKSGETWYLVMCDEGIGYLRNDMVK